jgi:hypothetical protein
VVDEELVKDPVIVNAKRAPSDNTEDELPAILFTYATVLEGTRKIKKASRPVVKLSWLEACEEAGALVPTEEYQIQWVRSS